MRLGFGEILLVLAIALLVFGPTKLPQLGDALGKGIRNFRKATREEDGDSSDATPSEAPSPRLAGRAAERRQADAAAESAKA